MLKKYIADEFYYIRDNITEENLCDGLYGWDTTMPDKSARFKTIEEAQKTIVLLEKDFREQGETEIDFSIHKGMVGTELYEEIKSALSEILVIEDDLLEAATDSVMEVVNV